MKTKVSVIVPIYKVEDYLCKCVDSLLKQTYKNIEIILVDDGSPDSCPRICDEYALKDNRVKVIHKKNGGLVSARKAGAIQSSGEYIACVDGDDWVALNYIEEFCHIINSYHPQIVCCGYIAANVEDEEQHRLPEKNGYYDKTALEKEIYPHLIQTENATSFLPTVWAKIIERETYLKHQMAVPDEISMGEDGACIIPLLLDSNNMFISEKCLYYYRDSATSMTRSKKPLSWENYDIIVKHLIEQTKKYPYDIQDQLDRRIAHSFFTVAKSRFNQDDSFKNISTEIRQKMNELLTKSALKNCRFKGSLKAIAILIPIKTRSPLLLALLNRIW